MACELLLLVLHILLMNVKLINTLSANETFVKGNQPPPIFYDNFAKFPILVKSNSVKIWSPFTHFLKAECLPKPIKQIIIGYLSSVVRQINLNMVRFLQTMPNFSKQYLLCQFSQLRQHILGKNCITIPLLNAEHN